MPFPTKGLSRLNHKDVLYRWLFRNRSGRNELWVEVTAAVGGQYLIALVPKVVNREMVPLAIDFAMANGWNPNSSAEPFQCVWKRGGFHLPDSPTPSA